MPRATAADAERTAQTILATATELFASHGVAGTSLEEVAAAALVTRGAVYHHYESKRGLVLACASALQEEVARQVEERAERAGTDPEAQLREGCLAFLEAATSGAAARVLLVEAPASIGWSAWRELDALNSGALLREAVAAVGVARDDVDATTAQLSGAMNEAALWIVEQPEHERARALARATAVLDRLISAVV